jgi:Tol biopolymer transport system component
MLVKSVSLWIGVLALVGCGAASAAQSTTTNTIETSAAPTSTAAPTTTTVPPTTSEAVATTTPSTLPEVDPTTSVARPAGLEMPDGQVVGGELLFTSDRDGDDEIYAMDLDGSDARQLTNNNDVDAAPVWSPDGTKIAFSSESGTDDRASKVYVMNADGGEPLRIVDDRHKLSDEGLPTWLPDGLHVAFVSHRNVEVGSAEDNSRRDEWMSCYGGSKDPNLCDPILTRFINPQVFIAGVDGSDPVQITQNPDVSGYQTMMWSPDGSQVAFSRYVGYDTEIFAMNADGSNVRQLTDNNDVDESPVWSPDGTQIAFSSDRFGDYRLLLMAADGTDVREITDDGGDDWSPVWSPDGRYIAFASTRCVTSICTPLDVLSTLSGVGAQIFVVDVASHQLVPTFEEGIPSDWR